MIRDTPQSDTNDSRKKRYLSIDVFKGFSVLLMVFANTFSPFENVPSWSQHAVDFGLTYVDLVAPFFVFMVALNFKISYNHRLKIKGKRNTYLRFIRRYLIFIGLGLVLTMYVAPGEFYFRWGTLQVLGTAGLALLFLIHLKTFIRLIISFSMLIAHQLLLVTNVNPLIYNSIEGGIFGMLSWTAMMILSSCIVEGLLKNEVRKFFLYGGIILTSSGIIVNFFIPFSRAYISASYTLISVGISSLIYFILYYIFEILAKSKPILNKEKFFSVVGKNAFILYLLDFMIAYTVYYSIPWDAPAILIFIVAFISVFGIWFIAYLMDRVKMYIVI
jgi:predicted acyltransferase